MPRDASTPTSSWTPGRHNLAFPCERRPNKRTKTIGSQTAVQQSAAAFDKTQRAEQYLRICHLPAELELLAGGTVAFGGLLDPDVEPGRPL
jgi:hypothetical protein